MTSFLHAHPWLLFFGALFVVFLLNAAVCWGLCKAAALGDRLLSLPPASMAGDGAQAPPGVLSSASADEYMREWDPEAGEYFSEWSR